MARKKKQNRRGHGEGSVYRRESDGRWVGSVELPPGPDGKRVRKTVSALTQAACLLRLADLKQGARKKRAAGADTLFSTWATEWLEDYKHRVKRRSYDLAKGELDKHIVPRLGDTPLGDLSVGDVRRLQNDIAAAVSARTGLHCRNRVLMILEAAKDEGFLDVNVAGAVKRLRQPKREMQVWTQEEVKRFLATNRGARDGPVFAFYLSTGLRRSEALALDWDDLKDGGLYVRVHKTVTWEAGRPVISLQPKTAAGRRDVPLNERIWNSLLSHKRAQERERQDPRYADHGLVFPNRRGNVEINLDRPWEKMKEVAGVPDIRIHDLRHTFVSMCIERGVNVVRLSKLIGHADPGFTLKVYAHLFERQERFVMPDLEDDLLG